MLSKAKVSHNSMIDLGYIRSTDRLWLIQDEILVLTETSGKLLLELDLKVTLNRIQEQDRILTWHLNNVIHNVFRLKIVELSLCKIKRMCQSDYSKSTEKEAQQSLIKDLFVFGEFIFHDGI